MSLIVKAGKSAKGFLKSAHILREAVPRISYTRRIERVMTAERICAMTFDDGPMDMPASPDQFHGRALTDLILDALAEFNAKGTFDVIGDTGMNYPDKAGKEGSAAWGGIRYDHYPDIHQDERGGAVHNDRLIRRMLDEGHQITNHGYRHILFGKKAFVYGKRVHYGSVHSAVGDLRRLDDWMRDHYKYEITMGRPPHYVDALNGGFTSYDVYDRMGYQYLAASFDGAGWLPSTKKDREALEEEIVAMTTPLRAALLQDPDFFCGQIIFQKDGYNMSRRTPVAWGLPLQLEILHQYGYRVVTVEELMKECPFADVSRETPLCDKMARLAKRRGVAYSDNRLRLEDRMTMGELAMLLAPKEEAMDLRWARMRRDKRNVHPYYGAVAWCKRERILPRDTDPDAPVTELPDGIFDSTKTFTRRAVYEAFREDWLDQGEHQEAEIRRIEEQLHSWRVTLTGLPAPDADAEISKTAESVTNGDADATQSAETMNAAQDAESMDATQDVTDAARNVADAEIVDAARNVTDAEIMNAARNVADAEIVDAARNVANAEIMNAARNAESVDAAQNAGTVDAARNAGSVDAAQNAGSVDAAQNAGSVDAAQDVTGNVTDANAQGVSNAGSVSAADAESAEPIKIAPLTEIDEERVEIVTEPIIITEPVEIVTEVHIETPGEIYVHALEAVYTEDTEDMHKIRNLPHVDDIPHVDGIPTTSDLPKEPPLFPDMDDEET